MGHLAAVRAAASGHRGGVCFFAAAAVALDFDVPVTVGVLRSRKDGHLFVHAWVEHQDGLAFDATVPAHSGKPVADYRAVANVVGDVCVVPVAVVRRLAKRHSFSSNVNRGILPRQFAVDLVKASGLKVTETATGSVIPA